MNTFPDHYLPGAISLLEQLDKKLMVVLRDGKTLIGYLRTIDQFANLVLQDTVERIHVDQRFGDIQRGIYMVRGENVVLAGEVDEQKERRLINDENSSPRLIRVSVEEILALQREQLEAKRTLQEAQAKALAERGMTPHPSDALTDDAY